MSAANGGMTAGGSILDRLERFAGLTEEQRQAATITDRDLLVSAGAGSGKTLTLVARYLHLLEQGAEPRQVAAITFTEKAAQEMRGRLRLAVEEAARAAREPAERRRWTELARAVEAGRIGTIHSLCAEILRAHPAEAGIDPRFELVDEARSAVLKAEAATEALAWAVDRDELVPLFEAYELRRLETVLKHLLDRRLELAEVLATEAATQAPSRGAALEPGGRGSGESLGLGAAWVEVADRLRGFLGRGAGATACAELRALRDEGALVEDAGDKLAAQVEQLLASWDAAEDALDSGAVVEAAAELWAMRRQQMALNVGRRDSQAKASLRALRETYEQALEPWLGGAKADSLPPDPALEARVQADRPRLVALYRRAEASYRRGLTERRALDFDDLEGLALELLGRPAIRARWQAALEAILVDEYQDTNHRQQQIVEALAGPRPGRRFVVGDARQSIYRFRGADVRVFRQTERELRQQGGTRIRLDRSFRSHALLTRAFDALLAPVMGREEDPERPHAVPYAGLVAHRQAAREGMRAPYVELVLGADETADLARPAAAQALADRLLELRQAGELLAWKDVALLFRASSGYPAYEEALEAAGIPYVTVAGSGFYERPEIRDLLNMLLALAEPWDDLALAGLLRSPAFGLSDAGLLRLRLGPDGRPRALRPILDDPAALEPLDPEERDGVARARGFLAELAPAVDRLPVAELLQQVIEACDYRAVLASAGQARLWRNLDKLLADAQAAGEPRLRAWLDYVAVLRDLGAREGEAPDEAEGAVQLMTVHRAKGLQFPLVVIADASHQGGGQAPPAFASAEGILADPSRLEGQPLALRLARARDRDENEAESARLLYVAATRAAEKLLISGHLTLGRGGPKAGGWLAQLLEAVEIEPSRLLEPAGAIEPSLPGGAGRLGLHLRQAGADRVRPTEAPGEGADLPAPDESIAPLFVDLPRRETDASGRELDEAPERSWRVTGLIEPPPEALGRVVHKLVAAWCFPDAVDFEPRLRAALAGEGLLGPPAEQARRRATELLARLRRHALHAEIEAAETRLFELPYVAPAGAAARFEDAGRIDLLYRTGGRWELLDFKTDPLPAAGDLERPYRPGAAESRLAHYQRQLRRYLRATARLLGVEARARLCFLDLEGRLELRELGDERDDPAVRDGG